MWRLSEAFLSGKSIANTKTGRTTWYFVLKRLLDFSLALAILIFLSPVMIVVAIMVKFDSPGPVLFIQKRVGARRVYRDEGWTWENCDFSCFKFRTMFQNASSELHKTYVAALIQNNTQKMNELQEGEQEINKLVHDPRITPLGRILRKYSLDELPQFFNVLKGDMSVVGPRPAIPYEVEVYEPWHKGRLQAQPGITGLQQVEARCTKTFDEQVKYDLEYIQKQSMWLDLKILVKTPLVVIKHKGAC